MRQNIRCRREDQLNPVTEITQDCSSNLQDKSEVKENEVMVVPAHSFDMP